MTIDAPTAARRRIKGAIAKARIRGAKGANARVVLKLSRAAKRRLGRVRSAKLRIKVVATSGSETKQATGKVKIRR